MAADEHSPTSPGPFSTSLGFELTEKSDGHVVMAAMPRAEHANGAGILHGGYLAALLDSTTGWAVHSTLPEGTPAPHQHLSVQYVRAGVPGRRLICTGRCVRAGRRAAAAEAEIVQDGKVLARAVSSHIVIG